MNCDDHAKLSRFDATVIGQPDKRGKVVGSSELGSGIAFSTENRHYATPPNRVASMSATIQSDRLDLITLTPTFLRASLDGDPCQAEMLMQLSLPPGWPVCTEPGWPDCRDLLTLRLQQLEDEPTIQPWLLRAIAPRDSRVMAGYIGFHTTPGAEYLQPFSPGAVEFGFTVFPPYRRKGYAREAACAVMRWAHQHHDVTHFVLSIRPNNVASQSLAASLGFVRIGSHIDEVDGLEEILECVVSGSSMSTSPMLPPSP